MTDHTTQTTVIDATPAQCFAVAIAFEDYPRWASDVKEVLVVRRDDDGRGGDVTFRAAAMGRSTKYTLRYYYGTNPLRIAWKLIDGDLTHKLDGDYEFVADPDDPTRTVVTYHLEAELLVPVPGFVKRRAEARIIRTALDDLRTAVEASVRPA